MTVVKSVEFIKSAVAPSHYPPEDFPEIAFAGRSNVGKSSLINCLVQRKKLVRTSRTPGQTQTINFFMVNDAFYFVDLPGYGFAKVSESTRREWGPMVERYMTVRKSLRGVVLILDIRHVPTQDDLQLWGWLTARRAAVIPVLTKVDKIGRTRRPSHLKDAAQSLGISPDQFILFSAETGEGREMLLGHLTEYLKR